MINLGDGSAFLPVTFRTKINYRSYQYKLLGLHHVFNITESKHSNCSLGVGGEGGAKIPTHKMSHSLTSLTHSFK